MQRRDDLRGRARRFAQLALSAALLLPVSPAGAQVVGTPHDMTLLRQSEDGPCVYCHVPHKAQGERLWTSSPAGPSTGWGSRPIAQLCYTCHDDTGGGHGAADMVTTAYAELSHGYRMGSIPPLPGGEPLLLPELPYVATELMDCTTCHDPHGGAAPFLRAASIEALCKACHGRENAGQVGGDNVFGPDESRYSLHPTDVAHEDIAANGPTRLHDLPASFEVATASGSWRLGGHRVGGQTGLGTLSCQTCHPVHGGWNYELGLMPGPPGPDLTVIVPEDVLGIGVCQSCHQGGDPQETVGEGTDHPINTNDGTPPTAFPEGWPVGTSGEAACTSCHDTHGGEKGTSLLRQSTAADGWCFSCHTVLALIPAYHHSTRENDGYASFVSVLTCGDCHGSGAGWKAHNGFEGFKIEPVGNRSALCELCHVPENPLELDAARYLDGTGLTISFTGAVFPALHGAPPPGTSSHPVDEADDDSIGNCEIKRTPWESTGAESKYGTAGELICETCHGVLKNAGSLLGTDDEARLSGGWRANLLVEPYEENSPGLGVETPDYFAGPTLSALCRGCHHSPEGAAMPTFVHNPAVHTVVDYEYPVGTTPYGRITARMLTTPTDSEGPDCPEVSSADQASSPTGHGPAPGAFSYPEANVMDCDSCHRPHGAHEEYTEDGKRRLLDFTAAGAHGTAPCLECHDTDRQCGFRPSPR